MNDYYSVVIYLLLVLFFPSYSFSQSSNVKIWQKNSPLKEIISYENELNPKVRPLKKNVRLSKYSLPSIDKYDIQSPYIIKRETDSFLPIYVDYYFSFPDSIVRYVNYDWEKNKFGNIYDKEYIWKEESSKLEEYNLQYQAIKDSLINQLGIPNKEDDSPVLTKSVWGNSEYLGRETLWETDLFYANLSLVFSSTTYRIRLNYYWK